MQYFQDWFTQQCVVLQGRKINANEHNWLLGPIGGLQSKGEEFIYQLADEEGLVIRKNEKNVGLLLSFSNLNLTEYDINRLTQAIISFYEHTSIFRIKFSIQWNPVFRMFAYLVNKLFSRRLKQLNIPYTNSLTSEELISDIIELVNPIDNEVKYKIWLRKIKSTGEIIFSGIYTTCQLPSKSTCIKAIFPLPNGNATVILQPSVVRYNELILDASGNKFGDAGFYFILKDRKNNVWSQYLKSFKDKLIISDKDSNITAVQSLKLWGLYVATIQYDITFKK